ncbi:hypothetical protein EPO04_01140 [Patescibacteria group bacterium]|nr:MAG: hypothetical protein EPO04_01140 [Patescibacteria group bacterium]
MAKSKPVKKSAKTTEDKPLKLSLACGNNKPEGFLGVDIAKTDSVDVVQNLLKFPWNKFKDNSVDEIECSHFVEHIPHGDGYHDPFFEFFDEIYRILKPAEFDPNNPNVATRGFMRITCPYYSSIRAWQDPTHHRAISEASFLYVNKKWREDNRLDHYPVKCDFDFSFGYVLSQEWQSRSQEAQSFAIRNYINAVSDIQVQLTKRA